MSKEIITTVRETTWDTSSRATFTDTFTLSNLGPLSTTFTPPSDCLNTWYVTNVHLELGVQSRTDCFPPGFTPENTRTSGYYSPGLCPSSYTAAESLSLWWTAPGETGVKCCPIGYWLPAEVTASCFTPVSPPVSTSYTDGTVVRVGVFTEIWAPAIPVLWKSLAEFNITTTSSGANPASTKTEPSPGDSVSRSTPATSTTEIATDSSGHATLNGGNHTNTTTIALATAIPIVIIALIIAAFLFLRRRARLLAAAAAIDISTSGLPELEGNADDVYKALAVELPALPAAIELPTRPARPVELPAESTPSALPTNTPVSPTVPSLPLNTPVSPAASPPADIVLPIAPPQDDQEMQWLNRELERVNERRENLRKLEALNDEHNELQRRINERLSGGRGDSGGAL